MATDGFGEELVVRRREAESLAEDAPAANRAFRPSKPAPKITASWKKFLRDVLIKASEKKEIGGKMSEWVPAVAEAGALHKQGGGRPHRLKPVLQESDAQWM
jgi:hypothetical protein